MTQAFIDGILPVFVMALTFTGAWNLFKAMIP
jgi:hypothetical protein